MKSDKETKEMNAEEYGKYLKAEARGCFNLQTAEIFTGMTLGYDLEMRKQYTGEEVEDTSNLVRIANESALIKSLEMFNGVDNFYKATVKTREYFSNPTEKELKESLEVELKENATNLLKILDKGLRKTIPQEKVNQLVRYSQGDFAKAA